MLLLHVLWRNWILIVPGKFRVKSSLGTIVVKFDLLDNMRRYDNACSRRSDSGA